MLVNKQNTEKFCTKFRQVCPQNADKVVRVEKAASRKSAGVRPALKTFISGIKNRSACFCSPKSWRV